MNRRRHHPERAGAAMERLLRDSPAPREPAPASPLVARPPRPQQQSSRSPQRLAPPSGPSAALVAAFRRAVGDAIAVHAFPKHFRKGVLTLGVDSPVWLQELSFLKEKLAHNMSREIGERVVTVHLVISKGPSRSAVELAKGSTAPLRAAAPERGSSKGAARIELEASALPDLPPGVASQVREAVAPLGGDPEVQEAAFRALSRWRERQRP